MLSFGNLELTNVALLLPGVGCNTAIAVPRKRGRERNACGKVSLDRLVLRRKLGKLLTAPDFGKVGHDGESTSCGG